MHNSREDKIFQAVSHLIMIVFSLIIIIPMFLLLVSSFTENEALLKNGYSFFTKNLSLDNYKYIFDTNSDKILGAYGISIILTTTGTFLGTLMTVALGFAISRPGLPGKKIITFYVFFTLLFNGGLVPSYLNYVNVFHLKNTFFALLIPTLLMNSFNVMLVKSYFVTSVHEEILEAATIDGASNFKKFSVIAMPMARPIIATIALFIGIMYWNDWNNGYIYLTTATHLYSVQNLLYRIQQSMQFLIQNASSVNSSTIRFPTEGVRMAIAMLGILPVIIIYPFVQNNFIKGISLGGIKG